MHMISYFCFLLLLSVGFCPSHIVAESENQSQRLQSFILTTDELLSNLNEKVGDLETKIVAFGDEIKQQENDSPVRASTRSIEKGRSLYMQYCKRCHGSSGRGNGPMSKFIPNVADLASSAIQNQSDRTIFDQITNGKSPMPAFRSLSEQDRWDLVNYVRSLKNQGGQYNQYGYQY